MFEDGVGNYNTYWIDANAVVISGSSYTTTETGGKLSTVQNGTTLTINVFIPSLSGGVSSSTYLYCRIGLPMNFNASFSRIKATIVGGG
jgi:hypothetical protein